MRTPIAWFGGKGRMVTKILPLIPEGKIYVEPFGGGASILLARAPSPVEVYNDIDGGLYDFFTVLADTNLFDKFYRRVALLPVSRQFFYDYNASWQDETDLIERVAKWFLVARQSFSGCFGGSWGYAVTASRRGMASETSTWLSGVEMLPQIHARLQRVQIECKDFRDVLMTYDTPETVFYLDPPYIHDTRVSGRYLYEMTDNDHKDLVQLMLGLKGASVLSGYAHEIYKPLSAEWRRYDFQTVCHAAGRKRNSKLQGEGALLDNVPRTECVWVKLIDPPQMALF
jgi:DNA adenine methylase